MQEGTSGAGHPRLKLKRILVTTDFSEESRKAFRYAAAFADQLGAELDVLVVIEPATFMSGMEAVPIAMDTKSLRSAAEQSLAKWIQKELPAPIRATPIVREGKAYSEIVSAAEERGADMIVISTHGYTGVKHLFMGSTAERVARHARCPVLIVREKEHEFVSPV
jgi:nucleotide-binding universal stress UspA family protein